MKKSVFFTSAWHEWICWYFYCKRWNIFGICRIKVNFLFILYSTEIQKAQPNFFLGCFSLDLTFAVCLLGITLSAKYLHLENGLKSYLNKWNVRNQHLKEVDWVCLRVGATCKLALGQVKQWCHYVWCWRHNMLSVIYDKCPSLKTFWWKIPVPKLPRKPCFATVKI